MINDEELVESLLYEEESDVLDKKRDQYALKGASDDEKSELLKDVLAFSNAWRRSDAFILIGVEEVKGGRSNVIGITELLDDASIQQFVNSKTNRPVAFSYRNVSFEDKHVALIQIPVQQRPIYIKRDFGHVKGGVVYVRRGSSTAMASIEEISKMGLQSPYELGPPVIKINFAEPKERKIFGDSEKITSLLLDVPKAADIPDYSRTGGSLFDIHIFGINSSYYKELVEYTKTRMLAIPLYFAVTNSGPVTANDVQIEMKIDKCGGRVIALDEYKYPPIPERSRDFISPRVPLPRDVYVVDIGSCWVVEAALEKVQPKATRWLRDPFYIGSLDDRSIIVEATVYSDQLNIPFQQRLVISAKSERRKVDLNEIKELERQRFLNSAEYRRHSQKLKTEDKT